MSLTLAAVLKRGRAIVGAGLTGIVVLSRTYLICMDWGMGHMGVEIGMIIMPAMQHRTAWDLVLVFLMWVVMALAMMVPAASQPCDSSFTEITRRRCARQSALVATGWLRVRFAPRRGAWRLSAVQSINYPGRPAYAAHAQALRAVQTEKPSGAFSGMNAKAPWAPRLPATHKSGMPWSSKPDRHLVKFPQRYAKRPGRLPKLLILRA